MQYTIYGGEENEFRNDFNQVSEDGTSRTSPKKRTSPEKQTSPDKNVKRRPLTRKV